jgi:hypothetical protein
MGPTGPVTKSEIGRMQDALRFSALLGSRMPTEIAVERLIHDYVKLARDVQEMHSQYEQLGGCCQEACKYPDKCIVCRTAYRTREIAEVQLEGENREST